MMLLMRKVLHILSNMLKLIVSANYNIEYYCSLLVQDIINKCLSYFTLQPEGRNVFSYLMNRKPQIKSLPQESNVSTSVKIEVCLFSGINITKKNKFLSYKSIGDNLDNTDDTKSLVEVKYAHSATFSSLANGLNPVWNENLILPLE